MNQQTTLDSLGLSFPRYLPRGIYKELKQHNRPSSIIMANIRRKEEEDKRCIATACFVSFFVYILYIQIVISILLVVTLGVEASLLYRSILCYFSQTTLQYVYVCMYYQYYTSITQRLLQKIQYNLQFPSTPY